MKFPAYVRYKDSAVPWLGQVPAHWEIKRLKHGCRVNPPKAELAQLPAGWQVSFLTLDKIGVGTLAPSETRTLGQLKQGLCCFRDLDVILPRVTPAFEHGKGACCQGLLNGIGLASAELHVLRAASTTDPRFLYYVTRSHAFRQLGGAAMNGSSGPSRVPDSFVENLPVAFPPLSEQQSIAAFLDRETTQLDGMITRQERLIQLLQEKRTALVSRVVTRGLDGETGLKHSGVPSLGDIPAHWDVQSNAQLFHRRCQRGGTKLPQLYLTAQGGVVIREYAGELPDVRTEDPRNFQTVHAGDVLFNKNRLGQGVVAVAPVDGLVTGVNVVLEPQPNVNARYLVELYRTAQYRTEITRRSHGTLDDRNRIYWDDFKHLRVIVPPRAEQDRIVRTIARETGKIEAVGERMTRAAERLAEYRSALISAAVTGQIDVRPD